VIRLRRGRASRSSHPGDVRVGGREDGAECHRQTPRAQSAVNARDAGFDAVELHGAHGYLLDEFLWTRTNLRTDSYGGSLAARTRFPAEVVAAVRGAVGPDYPIVYRFSQWKASDFGASIVGNPVELQELLGPLVDAGVDLFHPPALRACVPRCRPGAEPVWLDEEGDRGAGDRRRLGRAGDPVP